MKKILLVYPKFPNNTYWSFSGTLNFLDKRASMPPLGLITVAAILPKSYELKLIDMNVEDLRDEDIEWADYVFTSAMRVQDESLKYVINKSNSFGKPVIAGGPHPTSGYQDIKGVSHFILGEVESIIDVFIKDLENNELKKIYISKEKPSLKNTPTPRFDLLKLSEYQFMPVQFSRGCPFKCDFCDVWKMYGNKSRTKTPEQLLSELGYLYKLGWKGSVFLVDDNFIGNIPEAKRLLMELTKWQKQHKYPFRLVTEASLNLAHNETLLQLMNGSGFTTVFVGIETPHKESLVETNKKQNLGKDMIKLIKKIQSYGIEIAGGFIVGFDNDPENIFDLQIDFIQQAAIPISMVGLLIALKSTELYERMKSEGRLISESQGDNVRYFEPNFTTKMNRDKLIKGYKRILNTIYGKNLKNYFARCSRLLDNLGETPSFRKYISKDHIKTFIRSIKKQLFKPYGYQYIKFLVRNIIKHPNKLQEAIRLGVIGEHLRTITDGNLMLDDLHEYLKSEEQRMDYTVSSLRTQMYVNNIQIETKELENKKKEVLKVAEKRFNKLPKHHKNIFKKDYKKLVKKINAYAIF